MKLPLKIYLDTSDYNHLYSGNVSEHSAVLKYLTKAIGSGEVVVVLSYPIMMELFQDYDQEHWGLRLDKARFIKMLCWVHAFRFWMDIRDGNDAYSDSLDWHAQFEKEQFTIERFAKESTNLTANGIKLHKAVAKKVRTAEGMKRFIQNNPSLFDTRQMKHKFSNQFYEKDVLRRYILGQIPKAEANNILMQCLNDPVLFCENYYRVAGLGNHFSKAFHTMSNNLHTCIKEIRSLSKQSAEINCLMKEFDSERYWPNMYTYFPPYFNDVLNAYIQDNCKNPQVLQRSDMADMMHALYLPYSDIWRGDTKFSIFCFGKRSNIAIE